jgi:hypothetical protein
LPEDRHYRLYLFILAALLYLPALGARDFWAPVEPRYAEIARVMFAKGEWIVPTVNGDLYTDKPILYFWLVLIASTIAGAVNEWTVRLPTALAGVGLVLATYVMGRDLFSPRIGFIAGAVLATTIRVIWESRWAHIDIVFCFCFLLSLYFAARSLLRKGSPHEILYGYVFMALATLAKGLIGVVLPGLIFVSFIVAQRDWRLFAELRLPLGIPIFLLITAPWFWLVNSATDGQWLSEFIYVHHLQRYTAGSGHREPFYYYFKILPVDFLPWTIFAVPALFAYWPYRDLWHQEVTLFSALWFLMTFLFFSVSDTKRALYLLPAFPPLAFLVANYIHDLINPRLPQGVLFRTVAFSFLHLLWIGALALPIIAWFVRRDAIWIGLPSAFVMAAVGLAGVYYMGWRQPAKLFYSTVLLMLLTVVSASFFVLPHIDKYKSSRSFSLEVKRRVPPDVPLYVYADTMNDFNYYAEREVIPVVKSRNEVEKLLAQHSSGYILVKDRDLKRLNTILRDHIVATEEIGATTWNLVSLGN